MHWGTTLLQPDDRPLSSPSFLACRRTAAFEVSRQATTQTRMKTAEWDRRHRIPPSFSLSRPSRFLPTIPPSPPLLSRCLSLTTYPYPAPTKKRSLPWSIAPYILSHLFCSSWKVILPMHILSLLRHRFTPAGLPEIKPEQTRRRSITPIRHCVASSDQSPSP